VSALQFLLAPFCVCLILTGIHVYLGIHVLSRGVVFVDLALAQIAALGAMLALIWGLPQDSWSTYLLSLGFTLVGAAIFSLTRNVEKRKVPQEAIIGVTYAISNAAMILLADRAAHGADEIKEMLVGSILWVTWPQVLETFALYSIISGIHFLFRREFILVTLDPREAERQGYSLKLWDLLFYGTFGLVITSSVKIAGVLLVFSYLVVPSIVAMLFCSTIRARLMVGWSVGFVASVAGLFLSWKLDLPTGASLVVFFGVILCIAGLIRFLADRKTDLRAT
jgi:zinc/manganese transport system permease protein